MDNQHTYLKNLIDGLKNDNPEIRKKAILLIARMDNPKLIKLITPLTNDENEDVKLYAQKVIAILSKKYSQAKQLVEESTKESAKEELIKSNSFSSKLIELLSSPDFKIRIAALEQVNGDMPLEILNQIKSHLKIEQNEYVIATCIKSIGKFGKIEDTTFLKKYLLHTDPRIKSNTVEALISIGQISDILHDLLPLIDDKDDRIKVTVIQYFGRLSRSELLEALVKITYEGNENINTFVIKLSFLLKIDDSLKLYENIFSILSIDLKQLVVDYLKSSSDLNALDFIDQLSNKPINEKKFDEELIDEESKNIINVEELINDSPSDFSKKNKYSKFNFAFVNVKNFFSMIILLTLFYAIYSFLFREQYLYLAEDKNGKFIFINDSGKIMLSAPYDAVTQFSENYAGIKIGNKWGFINRNGKIVINPQFDFVFPFTQQRALVVIDKKMGFIDYNGKFVINPQFDQAAPFSEGLAAVKANNKWGFIDLEGNYAITPQFDLAFSFCEGLSAVIIGKKTGYSDKNGQLVIPPQFESATFFKEGLAAVKIGKNWGYINNKGNIVINPQFIKCGLFTSGLAAVMIGSNKNCVGFIDTNGKIIINPIYEFYKPHFIFEEINTDALDLFATTILLKLNYNNFNGMIPVIKNGKLGFIDKTGIFKIKPIFTGFEGVANDSLALVVQNSVRGYIDNTGSFIFKFPPKSAEAEFGKGYSNVTNSIPENTKETQMQIPENTKETQMQINNNIENKNSYFNIIKIDAEIIGKLKTNHYEIDGFNYSDSHNLDKEFHEMRGRYILKTISSEFSSTEKFEMIVIDEKDSLAVPDSKGFTINISVIREASEKEKLIYEKNLKLCDAIDEENIEKIKSILAEGANINYSVNYRQPLYIGSVKIKNFFIENGANVNILEMHQY